MMRYYNASFVGILLLVSFIFVCIIAFLCFCCVRRKQTIDLEKASIAPKPLDFSTEQEKKILNEVVSSVSETRVGTMSGSAHHHVA